MPSASEVVERGAAGLVAVHLLRDVALEVCGEAGRDGIARSQRSGALERRLHQRHHDEREIRPRREVHGEQLAYLWMLEEQATGRPESGFGKRELAPQSRTGRRHWSGRRQNMT